VKNLFTATGTGIAQSIYSTVSSFTDSVSGLIKTRKDGVDTKQRNLDRQIRVGEERLDSLEKQLTLKFARLEELLSRLKSQGSSLNFPTTGSGT
jgi:flagellar capping protein FliD